MGKNKGSKHPIIGLSRLIFGLVLYLILFVALVEVSLQIASIFFVKGKHPEPEPVLLESLKIKDPSKLQLYFVGDSYTYGLGASEQQFSYPGQLCKLLNMSGLNVECFNLGYPGTTSRDHLKVIETLPEKSIVFLRSGLNDGWNKGDFFKLEVLDRIYEIRILKFLFIALSKITKSVFNKEQKRKMFNDLRKVVEQKEHKVIIYDYPFSYTTFEMTEREFLMIPCWDVLRNSGLARSGKLLKKFLANDNSHLNDIGYGIDARVIYNALCSHKVLGLSQKQKLRLLPEDTEYPELEKRYLLKKEQLKQIKSPEELHKRLFVLGNLAYELSLVGVNKGKYKRAYQDITRILVFGYRDVLMLKNSIFGFRNKFDTGARADLEQSEMEMLQTYMTVFRSIVSLNDSNELGQLRWFEQIFSEQKADPEKVKIGMAFHLPTFYPLEFCSRLLTTSGLSEQQLSIRDEWQRITVRKLEVQQYKDTLPEVCK